MKDYLALNLALGLYTIEQAQKGLMPASIIYTAPEKAVFVCEKCRAMLTFTEQPNHNCQAGRTESVHE